MLEQISYTMQDASLCALGKSAANPVLTSIKYFRNEYEEHINKKKCSAGVCPNLTKFVVDPKKCRGCTACSKACPTEAITGKAKMPHKINTKKCISCGSCRDVCRFDAIKTGGNKMSEQIKVVIDGKKCTCDYGEYLYDVATRNGIFIPVLCRHEGFEDHRACCRICIVEVEINGRSKVVTSCVYPIERDCIVRTNSAKIKEERAVVMALLSRRAPDAKPIEQMANFMGADKGFDRLIKLDASKCILCGLCVQACDSLGTGAISTVNRGTDKEVNTPYGDPSASCIGCLSCASVCPTNAIEFSENTKTRTIWNRKFDLVKCKKCGEVIGTKEQIEYSRKGVDVQHADLCDSCCKTETAEVMRKSYGNN